MKWIVAVLLAGCGGTGFVIGYYATPPSPQYYISTSVVAESAIEAGINAVLTEGLPISDFELDRARNRARDLLERLYPDLKWNWSGPRISRADTDDV